MITLFVALYSLLCLCTTGKTSELKQLHTKTVKFGQDVIMHCDISEVKNKRNLALYRQRFGKLPQFIARWYGEKDSTLLEGFNDKRFSVTAKEQKFDLSINNVKEDDGGEYFCGYVEGSTLKFTSGTRLQFEGEEMKPCSTPGTLNKDTDSEGEGTNFDITDLHVKTVKRGEDVTMKCNISEVRNRNSFAWYRQSFGKVPQFLVRPYKSNQGYVFVEGFNDSRFSVTEKDQKFDLNINNIREDDGGEYFCGYVDGNILKFTSGTRLQFEGEEMKLCPTPGTLNKNTHSGTHQGSNSRDGEDFLSRTIAITACSILSVIAIVSLVAVLLKHQRKGASSSNHQTSTNQADDEDVLNYAAVNFAKKPSSSRTSGDIYAQVKIK